MEFLKQNKTTITIILGIMVFSLSYWFDLAVLMIKIMMAMAKSTAMTQPVCQTLYVTLR